MLLATVYGPIAVRATTITVFLSHLLNIRSLSYGANLYSTQSQVSKGRRNVRMPRRQITVMPSQRLKSWAKKHMQLSRPDLLKNGQPPPRPKRWKGWGLLRSKRQRRPGLLQRARPNKLKQRCVSTLWIQIFFNISIPKANKWKAMSQVIKGVPKGEQHVPPPPTQMSTMMANEEDQINASITQDKFQLHLDDPSNFLKLCTAIRILLHRQFTDFNVDHAERLIWEYCTELISVCPHIIQINVSSELTLEQLYSTSVIKPNHHYSTHVGECMRNYGPLYNFWTFLYEWLNKVLKSYKTNNHGHRELKTMFFNDFQKTCHISQLVCCFRLHSLKLKHYYNF